MKLFQRIEWRIYKEIKRCKLKNKEFTILSSNCNGAMIYFDMRLKLLTPTANLSFDMDDFVKMLENLEWYLSQPLVEVIGLDYDFPVGRLADVKIKFNH